MMRESPQSKFQGDLTPEPSSMSATQAERPRIAGTTDRHGLSIAVSKSSDAHQDDAVPFRGSVETDDEQDRLNSSFHVRAAFECFRDACETADPVNAALLYNECSGHLAHVWEFARVRCTAFHDLLALIEMVVATHDFAELFREQKVAVSTALHDLRRPFIDLEALDTYQRQFADNSIDVTRFVRRGTAPKRFRVTVDEITEA